VLWTVQRAREFDAYNADNGRIVPRLADIIDRAQAPVVLIRCSTTKGYVAAFNGAVGGFIQDCPEVKENFWIYLCRPG
jgi:hypothetical protein